jgi:hypothetical protein
MTAPARELWTFDVTVPAGTAPGAPQTAALPLPVGTVTAIEVLVPDGCNGVVGFRLASSGQQIVPVNTGAWVIASGETLRWSFVRWIESGAWQQVAYNTGQFDHTLHVRAEIADPPAPPGPAVPATPDLSGLTSAAPGV